MSGQVRSIHVSSTQDRSGYFKSGQVTSSLVRAAQIRPGEVK